MSSPKAPRQSPASAARPGSRWLLAVLLCAIFSTHAFAGFTPAIPSLVIDLDSPVWSTNLTSNWLSRGELERWADILLDETSWTPSTFSKLRAALLPVSSLSQDPPSPRKQVPFVPSSQHTLFDQIVRDIRSLSAQKAADPSLFRYNAIEERASTILGSSGVLVLDALADIADAVEPSSIVVAFEVSACAGIPTRRIHIDVSGCTETDLLASSASSPLKFGTSWVAGEGFRSCQRTCRDGVARISDKWASGEDTIAPTRIAIFSPSPLSECTALHLMTVNHFFGTPSLTSTETPPFSTWSMVNPIVLDKSPIWSDDQVAIMTADVPAKCYTGLKSVMDLLPPLDESMGKCGEHFSGFNWEMFREAFEHFMLDEERSDDWPSFSEIFMANFKNDSAALDGTWRSTFSTFTCAQWNALPLSMIQSPVFVPVLNAEGPNVNSPFDLINLALKLALSNPKLQTQIDDVAIKAISEVCLACAVVADISYDRLFRSVDVGSNSGPCVKGALLGGQGGTVASYLDSLAREVPQGPVAGTLTSTSQGDKDGTVAAVEIVRPDSVQASYFERCLIGTTLQFNISLENATVSIPEAKGFLGQIKHRLAPLSSFAPGQQLLVISGAIDSKQSIDITTISTKVSVDGKVATVTLPVVRNFLGWLQFTLNATYGNATLTTLLTKPLVCGFVTAVAQSSLAQTTSRSVNIRQPSSNTLSDLFRAEVIEIMTFEFDIDIRFHVASVNLLGTSEMSPYVRERLAFLFPQAVFLLLQSARYLTFETMNLPTAFKARLSLTETCSNSRFSHIFLHSSTRLGYRNDLFDVQPCFEETILSEESVTPEVAAQRRSILEAFAGANVELPSVNLITSKKTKQKLVIINTNWRPRYVMTHRAELLLLLFIMDQVRTRYGLPIIVGGVFDEDLSKLLEEVRGHHLDDWMWFPSSSVPVSSYIWTPTVPPATHSSPRRFSPVARNYVDAEECLTPAPPNASHPNICDSVYEYSKTFRKAVGGLLAEDRISARHEACAIDVGGGFLPVSYVIEKGGEKLDLVTFKIGSLKGTRLAEMTERVPQIFRFLASFDIVLLQTSTEDLADQRRISETILALLNAEQKAKGSGKISFENRLSSQDGPPNLHIFVKAENSRLRTLACSSQQYAASAFLTGCALIVQNRHPLIVTTLDDAVVPGTPWTNPTQDLPDSDAAAMKRQYGTLCRSFAKQAGVVTTGEDISDWCSRFPVSAVFAGSWGDIVDPAAGKGHLNRTFAEFKSAVEFVEHQILRKNQIGDRGFPKSRNDALRVRVVVPPERAPATEEELMYEGSLTISNVLGWLIGSKESSRALWPYWTNSWGAVSSFLVLWTSTDVPTNTPEIEPDVPMQLARVDEFLRSPVCGNRLLSHSLPGSIDRCSGSLPACSGPGFADVPERFSSGVTALRVDAAERPGSSSSRSLTDRSKASMCAAVSAREMENFKANRVAITITDQWMAHDEL